jgi:hypothetical protein
MSAITSLQNQIDALKEKQALFYPMLDNFFSQSKRETHIVMEQLKEKG